MIRLFVRLAAGLERRVETARIRLAYERIAEQVGS